MVHDALAKLLSAEKPICLEALLVIVVEHKDLAAALYRCYALRGDQSCTEQGLIEQNLSCNIQILCFGFMCWHHPTVLSM